MKFVNAENLAEKRFSDVIQSLPEAENLLQIMNWVNTQPKANFLPEIVAEVIVQDEFTHDVVIPYKDVFLEFDTT